MVIKKLPRETTYEYQGKCTQNISLIEINGPDCIPSKSNDPECQTSTHLTSLASPAKKIARPPPAAASSSSPAYPSLASHRPPRRRSGGRRTFLIRSIPRSSAHCRARPPPATTRPAAAARVVLLDLRRFSETGEEASTRGKCLPNRSTKCPKLLPQLSLKKNLLGLGEIYCSGGSRR